MPQAKPAPCNQAVGSNSESKSSPELLRANGRPCDPGVQPRVKEASDAERSLLETVTW